ncbi:hypothetical protein BV898_08261 [Hypsibius exemplaris]|uniref:Uncharacterized protein n=1 Tax=Hypsibius exemplaris TaxID=2072580 RepID=A0A1W0WR56_HYPEX|nr:hypothetical protein BV898_08261 [Hypsibius exemplaris]
MGEPDVSLRLGETSYVRNRSAVFILGVLEVLLGMGIIALETGALIMFYHAEAPGYPIEYAGIWTGVFAILIGIVQILAGKKTVSARLRRRLFAVGLGITIVCIIQALVLFGLTTYNIFLIRGAIARRKDNPQLDLIAGSHLTLKQLEDFAMLRSVVALTYISLAVLCLVSAVLDCCNGCGKTGQHGNGALPPDQVVYTSVDGNQVKQIKIYKKSHVLKS